MNLRSLRWQVQLGHIVMIFIGIPAIGFLLYWSAHERAVLDADVKLGRFAAAAAFDQERVDVMVNKHDASIWYVLKAEDRITDRSPTAPSTMLSTGEPPEFTPTWMEGNRVVSIPRVGIKSTLVVGMAENAVFAEMVALPAKLTVMVISFIALALGLGWWASNRVLAPIERFSNSARRIREKAGYEPLILKDTAPELRQLGMVLNDAIGQLHHSLEQQRNLTANASHELRTPVSLLLLELESALREERTPAQYQERLTVALDATKHLANLIDGLLILAKSDAGLIHYDMEDLRLDDLISDVVNIMKRKAANNNVALQTKLTPIRIRGNGESLRQLLLNLIDNALEHGQILTQISITLEQVETTVRMIISDDGSGIPPELTPRLFDRFYRGEASRTPSTKEHLGLGLTICRTIAEAHSGTIQATASESGGAAFLVELPGSDI